MEYAIVSVPAAPVRRKPGHQREMVSQLLFGESVEVLKEKGPLWVKVRSLHDGYEGWMTRTLLEEVSANDVKSPGLYIASDLLNTITINDVTAHIPMGSVLPGFAAGKGKFGSKTYSFAGKTINKAEAKPSAEIAERLSRQWLNAPYCWGGRTILGIDCSGFMQVIFKMMGIDLPRDAWQQAQEGSTVKRLKDAITGDLAFFDDKDEIVHVGMLLGPEQIIHASGKVRIDTIDKKGIINSDTGKRTHTLESIKRCW